MCKIRHVVTWLAVVVPVASLVAGSVLTMWGQGRADRRALERQRVSEALVSERERQARLDTSPDRSPTALHEAVAGTVPAAPPPAHI